MNERQRRAAHGQAVLLRQNIVHVTKSTAETHEEGAGSGREDRNLQVTWSAQHSRCSCKCPHFRGQHSGSEAKITETTTILLDTWVSLATWPFMFSSKRTSKVSHWSCQLQAVALYRKAP